MDVEPLDDSPLDLDEALPMQHLFWRLEWGMFGLLVATMAASLAGLFGGGWLSETEAVEGDLTVQYERFVRLDKTTIVTVTTDSRQLTIPNEYFRAFALERVVPTPAAQRVVGDDIVFDIDADGSRYTVQLFLTPMNPLGTTPFSVRSGDLRVDLSQFTFP